MRRPVLSEPDCRAVDLLLNHACTVSVARGCDPVPHQRIEAVRRVLSHLDKMPPIEPPAGLARRTMERIDRTTGVAVVQSVTADLAGLH